MNDHFFTYYDERGFSMRYPISWVRQNIMDTLSFVKPQDHPAIDGLNSNVNLLIQIFADEDEMNFEEFTRLTMRNMASDMPEAKDLTLKDVTLAGLPAKVMAFNAQVEDIKLGVKQYWFMFGNLAFLLTYTADLRKYDELEAEATAIILSFEFGFVDQMADSPVSEA